MLGKWIEESVMFQTDDVLGMYLVIFGVLLVIAVINFIGAQMKSNKK
ncbi:MAG: hypothetical protein R8K47_01020 [Mariprofundaceae bacterium]